MSEINKLFHSIQISGEQEPPRIHATEEEAGATMSINVQLHEGEMPYLVSPYEHFVFVIRHVKMTVESGKYVRHARPHESIASATLTVAI